MKTRKTSLVCLLFILLFSISSTVLATGKNGNDRNDDRDDRDDRDGRNRNRACNKHTKKFEFWWYKRHCTKVPEINASGAIPVIALLGGGIAFMYERKRRKYIVLTLS